MNCVTLCLFQLNLTWVELTPRITISLICHHSHTKIVSGFSFICAFSGKICILIPWPMEYYAATKNLRMSDSYVVKWKVSTIRSWVLQVNVRICHITWLHFGGVFQLIYLSISTKFTHACVQAHTHTCVHTHTYTHHHHSKCYFWGVEMGKEAFRWGGNCHIYFIDFCNVGVSF